ncbi:hypothetical protein D3C87_1710790 [compost metagenome]
MERLTFESPTLSQAWIISFDSKSVGIFEVGRFKFSRSAFIAKALFAASSANDHSPLYKRTRASKA